MKAFKCDICDKLYTNPTDYRDRVDPVTGIACGFMPATIVFGDEGYNNRTAAHDICPDCIDFFRRVIPVIREKGGTHWIVWPK